MPRLLGSWRWVEVAHARPEVEANKDLVELPMVCCVARPSLRIVPYRPPSESPVTVTVRPPEGKAYTYRVLLPQRGSSALSFGLLRPIQRNQTKRNLRF